MLHVPEPCRIMTHPLLGSTSKHGNNGAFTLPSPEAGWELLIICSDVDGWEHVSVHARQNIKMRIPTWKEMCHVKNVFWDAEDLVMQVHPRKSRYVNLHPGVLHMWRPIGREIPEPPSWMVGPEG